MTMYDMSYLDPTSESQKCLNVEPTVRQSAYLCPGVRTYTLVRCPLRAHTHHTTPHWHARCSPLFWQSCGAVCVPCPARAGAASVDFSSRAALTTAPTTVAP
jgi:hypothetical protein